MPLLIELKANDKVIINGAVIENISSMNTKLMLHNQASILREREIISAEDASTPAARVYYDLQCAYVFKEHREEHMRQFQTDLNDFITASPSAQPIADEIIELIERENYYKALKVSKKLIVHEAEIFKSLSEALKEVVDSMKTDDPATEGEDEPQS